jgi:hypothetical protein
MAYKRTWKETSESKERERRRREYNSATMCFIILLGFRGNIGVIYDPSRVKLFVYSLRVSARDRKGSLLNFYTSFPLESPPPPPPPPPPSSSSKRRGISRRFTRDETSRAIRLREDESYLFSHFFLASGAARLPPNGPRR